MNYNQDQFFRYNAPQRSISFESDYTIQSGEKVFLGRAIPSLGVVLESIQRGFKRLFVTMAKKDQVQGEEWENQKRIFDPQGTFLQRWNKMFAISCLIAAALDSLFLYIPVIDGDRECLTIDKPLQITTCVLRSFIDLFYVLHIILSFRTGFISKSFGVFGRGALVCDPSAIAKRYLSSYFLVDILSILPLPQVAILFIVPSCRGLQPMVTKEMLIYIIFLQYVPRLFRIYPLFEEVTGILTETDWGAAAFNLLLYLLASHIVGACWYLFSVAREEQCWLDECHKKKRCNSTLLYCRGNSLSNAGNPFKDLCKPTKPDDITDPDVFNFGIFFDALRSRIVQSKDFRRKFSYSFWWGLRNVSSLGSNLQTSTFMGEIVFAASITIFGLILFAMLIGNMQKYLELTTVRIEETRVRRRDAERAERWMSHRVLPEPLRERLRRYEQYKWQETRVIEEDGLFSKLPKDLRRDIKRHLCLDLLMKVPMFQTMDEQLVDAMCDCLKPMLYTENSTVIRESDPVDLMLFIMRGNLKTTTTYGGFFNTAQLKPGDFCGDELLTWALDPTTNSSTILPYSTRTVVSLTEVEAFALTAEDLKFVASQFRHIHSKQLQHTFRFYSLQWRTWGACIIQGSWRCYLKKKHEKSLREAEYKLHNILRNNNAVTSTRLSFRASILAARFAVNILGLRRGVGSQTGFSLIPALPPQRPSEPDFTS